MAEAVIKKEQEDATSIPESLSTSVYHEDLKSKDHLKVFDYVVETLETKRDKYLISVEKKLNLKPLKKNGFLIVFVILLAGFLWFMFKGFLVIYALGLAIFHFTVHSFIGCFLCLAFAKWIQNHSYIAFDKEINNTVAENGFNIFGFNITSKEIVAKQDLSNVHVFRNNDNSAIVGLVVLKPFFDAYSRDEEKCVVQIGIMAASEIEEIYDQMFEEMLEWCISKTQTLKEFSHKQVYLQIEILGLDNQSCVFLSKKNFKNIKSHNTTDEFLASMMPLFKRHVFELEL